MKLMFISDIHGSAYYLKKALEIYKNENADKLVILGDILYHGPRNDLPIEYAPKEVAKLLNDISNELLCVRGNCDAQVDQMVLNFPILADYAVLYDKKTMIYLTHGHIFNENNLPPLKKGDILINGHTHIYKAEEHEDYVYINPGSISLAKNGNENTYMIYENGIFNIKTFENKSVLTYNIK